MVYPVSLARPDAEPTSAKYAAQQPALVAKEGIVHASIIDMTLRLPVDRVLFDKLRTDFLPRASQHPGFRGWRSLRRPSVAA
jgi:hypothetical protein